MQASTLKANLGVSANLTILYHCFGFRFKVFLLALTPGSRGERKSKSDFRIQWFSLYSENFWGLLVIVGIGMLRIHTWIGRLSLVDLQTLWGSLSDTLNFWQFISCPGPRVLFLKNSFEFLWHCRCPGLLMNLAFKLGFVYSWYGLPQPLERRSFGVCGSWDPRTQLLLGKVPPTPHIAHCSCGRTKFVSPWCKSPASNQIVWHLSIEDRSPASLRARREFSESMTGE